MRMDNYKFQKIIKPSIVSAIKEDIGSGDLTTNILVPSKLLGTAIILVKENCILGGVEVCKTICELIDKKLVIKLFFNDGDEIAQNTTVATIKGPVKSILKAERLILNYMQRMSGIATKTHHYCILIKDYKVKLLDTRKTTPNFRLFEKWAVRIGGGVNHRFGLYDEILIKDNHIEANNNILNTLEKLNQYLSTSRGNRKKIIVEIKNKNEFIIANKYPFVDRILIDNLPPFEVKKLVQLNSSKKALEVSGGINMNNVKKYAATGVDYISVGELTHHINSIDISLNLQQ